MKREIYKILTKIKAKRILKAHKRVCAIHESTIFFFRFGIRFDQTPSKREYISIGERNMIGCKFIFETTEGKIEIGDNCFVGGGTLISRSLIKIGNNVTMAWGITVYDHDSHSIFLDERKNDNSITYECIQSGGFNQNQKWEKVKTAPIVIEDNVWIGFDAVILKGVKVGEGAVIAARSVVTKNVEPYTLVAGNPARFIKNIGRSEDEKNEQF